MIFNTLIASTILSFVAAVPAPIDWNTVSYDVDWKTVSYDVDWKTVSYDFSGVDWKTVSYDFSGINWATVNYGGSAAPTATAQVSATSPATASATATSTAVPTGPFSFISTHSGEIDVHLQPVFVADSKLRLGANPPESYTPTGVSVPTTSVATFNVGQDTFGLNVVVPGGQELYVNTDGSIGYTVPHSADTPAGAVLKPFAVSASASFSYLTFDGKQQFLACPASGLTGVFDVYVAEKTTRTDCIGVGIVGQVNSAAAAAYEWN